jgi:hypothetical protein
MSKALGCGAVVLALIVVGEMCPSSKSAPNAATAYAQQFDSAQRVQRAIDDSIEKAKTPAQRAADEKRRAQLAALQSAQDAKDGKARAQALLVAGIAQRKEYGKSLELEMLSEGMDAHVTVIGADSDVLHVRYIFCSRPFVYNAGRALFDKMPSFRRFECDDGYGTRAWLDN